MSETVRVSPGYRYSGETIEITQKITEQQFQAIAAIHDESPQRFKEWSDRFVFEPATPGIARRLRAYLREQRIAHTTELLQTFVLAVRAEPAARSRR